MSAKLENETATAPRRYFVDEAGDSVLFGRRGERLFGRPGCSRFFVIGCLEIAQPEKVASDLEALRRDLLADTTINRVPSMTVEQGKTALAFHAKDDIPEVRRDVFKLLMRHEMAFDAVVRDKSALATAVRVRNEGDPTYRYNENEVYDTLVARLFRERLHKADRHAVVFARRGHKDRTLALAAAMESARAYSLRLRKLPGPGGVSAQAAFSRETAGLQAVDYFLWALQRLYERGEERYLHVIWPKVRLVMDIDDTRTNANGERYSPSRPLTLATLGRGPEDIGINGGAAEHTA